MRFHYSVTCPTDNRKSCTPKMKLLTIFCFAVCQVTGTRKQECFSVVRQACPDATVIGEVPAWLDPSDSPATTPSGVHATNCNETIKFTSKTYVNCLGVLALSSKDTSRMILDRSSFNATGNSKVQSLSWRLAKLASISIKERALEGVEINLYIYDVNNFTVAQGAFVNCRGSISMHNVNAFVDKGAAIDSNILFIRHGELSNTSLRITYSSMNSTKLEQRVFAFTSSKGGADERSSTSTNEIVLATFSVEIAVLVTCCATLITAVILFVSMQKLYRQNYEAIARENKTQEVRSRANDVPNLPLPPRPPPEVVTPNKRPKAKNCV